MSWAQLFNWFLLVTIFIIMVATHTKSKVRKNLSKQIDVEADKLIYHLNNGGAKHLVRLFKNGNSEVTKVRKTDLIQL